MSPGQDPWASAGSPPEARSPALPPGIHAISRVGRDKIPAADRGIAGQEPGSPGEPGACYLLHFPEPYKHAHHYSGHRATDLQARLAEHETGHGSRLLQVAKAAGTWILARTWVGGRKCARQLRAQGGASRRCPECGVKHRTSPAERKE